MAQVPEMSLWVRAGMMVIVVVLVVVIVAYHAWLDRLLGHRQRRHGAAPGPTPAARRAD